VVHALLGRRHEAAEFGGGHVSDEPGNGGSGVRPSDAGGGHPHLAEQDRVIAELADRLE
jgi:hypothetical protein